jgi:hypothetical protein
MSSVQEAARKMKEEEFIGSSLWKRQIERFSY